MSNEAISEHQKKMVLDLIRQENPQTTDQLVASIKRTCSFSDQEIENMLIQLEAQGIIKFKSNIRPSKLRNLLSTNNLWYWGSNAVLVLTVIAVFTISDSSAFFSLRAVLGIFFVVFLPGYAFMKAFLSKALKEKENMLIKVALSSALSIGLSLCLVSLMALFLNYTPFGVQLIPLVTGLSIFTFVLSTFAFLREYRQTFRL